MLSKLDPWWWAEAHTRPLWLISEERTHNQSSVRVFVLRHYDILIPLHTRGDEQSVRSRQSCKKCRFTFLLKRASSIPPFLPPSPRIHTLQRCCWFCCVCVRLRTIIKHCHCSVAVVVVVVGREGKDESCPELVNCQEMQNARQCLQSPVDGEGGICMCKCTVRTHTSLTTKLGYLTLSSRGLEKIRIRVCVRQGSNKCTWMFTCVFVPPTENTHHRYGVCKNMMCVCA